MNDINVNLEAITLRFDLDVDSYDLDDRRLGEFEFALDEHLTTLGCGAYISELELYGDLGVTITIDDPKLTNLPTIIEKVRTMVYTTAMWKLL